MFRTLSSFALVLVTIVGMTPALAEEQSSFYSVATTPIVSVSCSDCFGMNIGGATLVANGEVPVKVFVEDASLEPVSFTVCQDLDDDGLCGEEGEPTTGVVCGYEADLPNFSADSDVVVFVELVSTACSVATSGSITVQYG